ncbi:GNAT family N-acetyltransferase [Acuticoccus sp.]|uniref:GNAT family N-acetyltransferase n=1 Tax=Acuticoccus sp. TaxID=1904378 RepID=UPI003B52D86B
MSRGPGSTAIGSGERGRRPPAFRRASGDDAVLVRPIIADAFAGRAAEIGRAPEPLSLDADEAVGDGRVILAEAAGRPIGCAVLRRCGGGTVELEVLAVVRDAQGTGVGSALLARAEREARRQGAHRMTLYTSARLPANLAFYAAHGYHETHRTGMSAVERVHLAKALPPPSAQKAAVDALYGRRRVHGHRPHPAYDRLALDLAAPADLSALFGDREVRVEVGFGGGEHLLHHARTSPDVGLIGVEPFETGMMRTAAAVEAEGLANVRLHMGDARRVLEWLPSASVTRVDVLYPDPWHKQRHWKRRFISVDGLDRLARVVAPGGTVRLASDIQAYVDWTRAHVAAHPAFALECDAADPWEGWPGTRYEAKALREGRIPRYLTLRRLPHRSQ